MSGTACGIVQPFDVAEQLTVGCAAKVEKPVLFIHPFGQFSIPVVAGVQKDEAEQYQRCGAQRVDDTEDQSDYGYSVHSAGKSVRRPEARDPRRPDAQAMLRRILGSQTQPGMQQDSTGEDNASGGQVAEKTKH